ncbi:MAG TPA: hypothetical protein VI094_23435 [Propionibacteriaceae bacterium]
MAGQLVILDPGLGGHLDSIPWGTRGGVSERSSSLNASTVMWWKRAVVDVDPLSGFGAFGADELRAEQPPGHGVAGDPDGDRLCSGVVGLVVIRAGPGWCVVGSQLRPPRVPEPSAGGD